MNHFIPQAITRASVALALSLAVSCAPHIPNARGPALPPLSAGPIRVPGALAWDFEWHQRVTATYPEGSSSFEAVLQHREGRLRLIGLSPMGLPGFIITVDARGRITMDNRSGQELPFTPEYIVADVQRVFFPWFPTPPSGLSGQRQSDFRGLHITETFEKGVLRSRTFSRDDAPARGQVQVHYESWERGMDAPRVAVVDNQWFGYTLRIDTEEQSRL